MCQKRKQLARVICLFLFLSPVLPAAESDDTLDLRTLALAPAAEPVPALRYRLLPDIVDQVNGNAALFYHGAAELCPDVEKDDLGDKIDKWRDSPLDKLPREEVDRALATFENSFRQIKLATLRNQCAWEMPLEEGYAMLLPGLSTYHNIVRAMALRARLEIADGNVDQALQTLQQGLSLGRGIGRGPTLIQGLVGIAISAIVLEQVESLMESEHAPNLYWALTALPTPFIDMRRALEYERGALFLEFPSLHRLNDEIMTPLQASALVNDFFAKMQPLEMGGPKPFAGVLPVGWVMLHYTDAKRYLATHGLSEDRIEAMPAAQAVMLYQVEEHLALQDSLGKWFFFPHHLAQPRFEEADRRIDRLTRARGLKGNLLTAILLPALSRVSFMQARLERQICLLRTIEGLRMYAADHDGRLPSSLTEIDKVPVPLDPVTGKAFGYQLRDDGSARLEAPAAPSEKRRRPVYELTIRP